MKFLILIIAVICGLDACAQKTLQSVTPEISVIDCDRVIRWTIVPDLEIDPYASENLEREVIFASTIDTLIFKIHRDSIYLFDVDYNGRKAKTLVKYEPAKLDVLKNAGDFRKDFSTYKPQFTYESMSSNPLKLLREKYNLDSIAGGGNEISQLLELMHWLHNKVSHDGNHGNPKVKNADAMMEACKDGSRGLNCRGLAMTLNEIYLSMGFKSTYLTCLPKDSLDTECHVVNMVYVNELSKWVYLDPTHDAYVMNAKGVLLDPFEIREHLIADKTLILNPNANWNHRQSSTLDYYIKTYMAKNLYRFSTPLMSRYDNETWKEGKKRAFVELVPSDYFQYKKEINQKIEKEHYMQYTISNPTLFFRR